MVFLPFLYPDRGTPTNVKLINIRLLKVYQRPVTQRPVTKPLVTLRPVYRTSSLHKVHLQNVQGVLRIQDVYPGSRIQQQQQTRGKICCPSYLFVATNIIIFLNR